MIHTWSALQISLLVLLATHANAQPVERFTPSQPRDAQEAILPDTPLRADLKMKAIKATTWSSGGTTRVLLDRDVEVSIGSYGFKAKRAIVFISPPAQAGQSTQLAMYLDTVSELGGDGPVSNTAKRLLVTAAMSGGVKLVADRLEREAATDDPLVQAGAARLTRYYTAVRANTVAMGDRKPLYPREIFLSRAERQSITRGQDVKPIEVAIDPDGTGTTDPITQPPDGTGSDPGDQKPPIDPKDDDLDRLRSVQFNAGRIVYQEGEEESYALLVGDVRVMYHDPNTRQGMSLAADRAVIFTAPGALSGKQANYSQVRGVYLEGNVVATNGDYTLRGPRVFYDLQTDRAVVVEAVFFTWDIKRQVPIYMRAKKLKQVSTRQWKGEHAKLSTSEFAEPHFSLGAREVTIDRVDQPSGAPQYQFKAKDLTMRAGDIPIFYWPGVSGTAANTPLRRIQADYDSRDGVTVKTRWDLFALADRQPPEGVQAFLLADAYTNRGGAVGLDVDYSTTRAFGRADAYLMYDVGDDEPGGRDEVEPEDNLRGMLFWQHRHDLPDGWEVSAELGYISDPTFLEEFFPERVQDDKPWETSLYVKKQEEDWAFTFLVKHHVMDFVPQYTQLQTPGYTVDKLPELAYYRVGTPLFNDTVTWFSENRASVLKINFPETEPRDLGFNMAESIALFGMAPTMPFDAALGLMGLDEDLHYRFDTRQELNLPLKVGPVDVVPYLVGRLTGYDEDFMAFAGEEENIRYWLSGGVKLHTAVHNTYDDVESRLLDVHRLRHIIEPSINVSYAYTNIEQQNLPVFDYDVESLAEGGVVRLGLHNTLQTQRGGPGNWRSVDWIRIDTDFVIQDSQTFLESPIPQFFNYRPEYSLAGDHFWGEAAWQITDTLSSVGNITYSFESNETEAWNFGLTYDHNPRLTMFTQLRFIDNANSLLLRYGVDYLLSAKYHVSLSQAFDLENEETRDVSVVVTRRFPRMLLRVAVSYDTIGNNTSIGFSIVPEGVGGSGEPERNPFIFTR